MAEQDLKSDPRELLPLLHVSLSLIISHLAPAVPCPQAWLKAGNDANTVTSAASSLLCPAGTTMTELLPLSLLHAEMLEQFIGFILAASTSAWKEQQRLCFTAGEGRSSGMD